MHYRRLLFLFGLALTLPALAVQGVHRWVDENGQVVYSQFAPGEGQASQLVKPPPPPAESPEVAKQRLQQQVQVSEDRKEDQALAGEKTAVRQSEASQARQRCEAARRNLQVLNGRPRQLYQLPDGSVTRMSEEDRQKKRAEMQAIIDKDCR